MSHAREESRSRQVNLSRSIIVMLHTTVAGESAYTVTFWRAGEDNKSFRLGEIDQTLQGKKLVSRNVCEKQSAWVYSHV